MFTQPFHDFHTHNAFLSEDGVLAAVDEAFPQTLRQTWDNKDFPCLMRQGVARLRLARRPLGRRGGAPHERGESGGSDPHIFAAGAAPGRVGRFTPQFTVNLPFSGSLPPQ